MDNLTLERDLNFHLNSFRIKVFEHDILVDMLLSNFTRRGYSNAQTNLSERYKYESQLGVAPK